MALSFWRSSGEMSIESRGMPQRLQLRLHKTAFVVRALPSMLKGPTGVGSYHRLPVSVRGRVARRMPCAYSSRCGTAPVAGDPKEIAECL